MIVKCFTVNGEPFAKQRPRFNRKQGRTFTPPETLIYENLVKTCFANQYPYAKPSDLPATINIFAEYPIPESWPKKKKQMALEEKIFPKRHDWDNVGKIICDALNGIAYLDDRQIFMGSVKKVYGDEPHVTVVIAFYEEQELGVEE